MQLVSNYLDKNFNPKRDYRIPVSNWYKSQYSKSVPFSEIKNSVDRSAIKDALRGEDRLDEIKWYKYIVTQCPVNQLPPSQWEVVGAVNKNNVVDLMESVKKEGIRPNQPISIMVKDRYNEMYTLGGNHRLLALKVLEENNVKKFSKIPCVIVIDK